MLANTRTSYGWIAIALHWISAIGIIWLYFLGINAEDAPNREAHRAAMAVHISVGVLFFSFIVARLISSATQVRPDALGANVWFNRLAALVHILLLVNIAVLIVTGPLAVMSMARPVQVFDWFAIPSPFASANRGLHEIAEKVHVAAHFPLLPLLGVHVLGALKHVVIDRDATLTRMLWPRKREA